MLVAGPCKPCSEPREYYQCFCENRQIILKTLDFRQGKLKLKLSKRKFPGVIYRVHKDNQMLRT